ncbi:manganese efflux pump MntP [Clostridium acetireducens DSM 10703]|jgi:putative sporulation protein YtaF|uniref:Manganese efflux pump MntP n=1 Tax=Clostridium acetireducens DSM 10703 TaxID=1121290 RepID=A0A1E8F0N7_9CLOT|nr:sporulation membrane protein YtaF [Clostridium acetireducens]OFI06980.1 manganese efflux pump MntP [Clostridium acetireducens DSM 10703]
MHFISLLLFVLSANIDNIIVGITYGIKQLNLTSTNIMTITIIITLGTAISMYFGKIICLYINSNLANNLGSGMLIILGLWYIVDFLLSTMKIHKNKDKTNHLCYKEVLNNPEKADIDKSGSIDFKECTFLSIALTLNNSALGISASLAGLNIKITIILTFIIGILTIKLGLYIGRKCTSNFLNKYANLISGFIIILVGIIELII